MKQTQNGGESGRLKHDTAIQAAIHRAKQFAKYAAVGAVVGLSLVASPGSFINDSSLMPLAFTLR